MEEGLPEEKSGIRGDNKQAAQSEGALVNYMGFGPCGRGAT